MSLKVFTDLHHGDLYYSLHKLFEVRLGWELYRPIGWDWFDQGFWKIGDPYPNPRDTAGQYLEITMNGIQLYKNANGIPNKNDHYFEIHEPFHNYVQKAITLEQFKDMHIDLVVASFPTHCFTYEQLCNQYKPKAKIISQVGNIPQHTHLKHVLHSVPFQARPDQNTLYYHQEINLSHYYFQLPQNIEIPKKIYSFVNCLPFSDVYNAYKKELYEVQMCSYGGGCPDGSVQGAREVSEKMRESSMGWHLKINNGMGHNTMGWYASGRPVIMRSQDFLNYQLPDIKHLMEHKITCIDLDRSDFNTNLNLIRNALQPEENTKMCNAAYARFKEVINYDMEAEKIKKFLENIIS